MATDFNPNVITGLASGMDTKAIIEQMVTAQKKKIEPIVARQEQKQLELDAWKQVEVYLDAVKGTSSELSTKSLWEGKIVSSSHPEIVEAIATSGAKPGKHTLVVDKLALNHQIASQNFESKDDSIGRGSVLVSIGEGADQKIVIDESNDTVQGFADAINALEGDVSASIIKTGKKDKPFQIVLTSKKTGLDGKINMNIRLSGEGEAPTFEPYYTQPSKWKGIRRAEEVPKMPTGTGASTAIPELIGDFTGDQPIDLTFTVVNTGIVGVSETLRMRWEDDTGRFGYLDLGSFNYTPGEPIEIVDGISLVLSDGEVIVNDSFKAQAKNEDSELYWWKSDAEKAARIDQPTSWLRQSTEGGPIITGKYLGEDDDFFTVTVKGSGQVGQAEDLTLEYESENGMKGVAFIGKGYEPGTKLSIGQGLEISLKPGLLQDGDYATFEYEAESTMDYWWLEKHERHEGGSVTEATNWISPQSKEGDAFSSVNRQKPVGARVSTALKQVTGTYTDFEPKTYTFTVMKSGSVGVTKDIELKWEDNKGNSGTLDIGDTYTLGDPIEFDSGLSIALGDGSVFETDSFTFKTFTPVIQPPQDAEIRFGATDLGGGLLITNSTNTLEDVIDGVKLNLLATSESPITINIRGDTEKALDGIKQFVESYNSMLYYFREVSKYDKDTNEAAPLQGDRNLPRIQSETASIFINTIAGLEKDSNMLLNIGLKVNQEGLIDMDEEKLKNAITDDLSRVANLFRSYGRTENSGIVYLSSSEKTKISGDDGYDIDITQVATKGSYRLGPILQPISITDENRTVFISVNGRESKEIVLEKGIYTPERMAKELQNKILNDKFLGKMRVAVTSDGQSITIRSNVTGSRSKVTMRAADNESAVNHPLLDGETTEGKNVEGTINGVAMEGSGQILSGVEETDYDGLKLFVSLSENQIGQGAEDKIIFTKGVATKVKEYIDSIQQPETGALGLYTKSAKEQLEGFKKEVKTLEERVEAKRVKWIEKFAKMEGKLGQLKNEQQYLSKELAKLG